jgi:hypothetical protein
MLTNYHIVMVALTRSKTLKGYSAQGKLYTRGRGWYHMFNCGLVYSKIRKNIFEERELFAGTERCFGMVHGVS